MGYYKKVINGFSWAALLNAAAMGVSFIKIVILSRFIFGPTEFGIFGIGVVLLGILELITETGINIFLVQDEEPLTTYLDTAWVVSIIRGVLIAIFVAVLSYPISLFFKIGSFRTFILAFSLIPLLRGFINPAIANLQKKLRFKEDAIFRSAVSIVEDFFIVSLAVLTHNIFSFVIGMVIGVLIEVSITFIFVREKPKFRFNFNYFKRIVDKGKTVTLAQIFDYLFEHTDDLVVGRILNVASLGIYQNSYTLSSIPENVVAQQLGKVTFPIFVNIRGDKERTRKAFLKSFLTVSIIVIPFGVALFFLSDPLIRTFLGMKWLAAIPVLKVLALFSVVRALTNVFYPVFLAYKRQDLVMIITLISWVVLGIFIFPLTKSFGVTGAALSALLGSLAGLPTAFILLNKVFDK